MVRPEEDAVRMAEKILGSRSPEDFLQHTVSEDRKPYHIVLSLETAGHLFAFTSSLADREKAIKPEEKENMNGILKNKFSEPLVAADIDENGPDVPLDNPMGHVYLDLREMGHLNKEMVKHFSLKRINPVEKAKIMGSFLELNKAWIRSGGIPDESFTSRFGLKQ